MPPAIPIIAAVGAFIAANASWIVPVVSVVVSAASYLFAPKPKQPSAADFASRAVGSTFTTSDPVGYWRIGYGEFRMGGNRLYRGTSDGNDKFHEVVALLAHEIDGFGTTFVDDEPVYQDQLDADGYVTSSFFWAGAGTTQQQQYLRLKFKTGTADQTAFADLVAESPDGEWTEDHRARGHALLYARARFSRGLFPSSPNYSVVVRAKRVYDTRDGQTKFTPNAALCIRDYLLLPRNLGGYGYASDEIGTDAEWSAAANICDEIVATPTTGDAAQIHTAKSVSAAADTIDLDGDVLLYQRGDRVRPSSTGSLPGGLTDRDYFVIPYHERHRAAFAGVPEVNPAVKLADTLADAYAGVVVPLSDAGTGTLTLTKNGEPRYVICGWFDTKQSPRKVLEELLTACGGRIPEGGGRKRLLGLAWETPVLSLNERSLRRGAFKVSTKRSFRDRFNAVKGTFVSPLNDWQPQDYPAVTSATYEAQDGERIYGEYEQPYTPRSGQAQRIAKLELARNRFERTATLPCKLAAYDCLPGQVIAVSNDFWDWVDKPFEVIERKPVQKKDDQGAPYNGIDYVINETHEDIYDWASSEEAADPPLIPPTLPDWAHIPAPGSPAVTESLYEGRDGSDVKARVTLSWMASSSNLVEGYEVEYRLSAASTWQAGGVTPKEILTLDINDVDPGTYDFRVRGVTDLTASPWSTTINKVVFGLEADPVAITGLTGLPLGGQFVMRWDLHADPDVLRGGWIEFRHSPVASGASEDESTSIGDRVPGRETQAHLPFKAGTYFARAIDKLGNTGPWASVVNIGDTVLAWSTVGSIQEDSTFPGTHSGTAPGGMGLTLDGATPIDSWGLVDSVLDWDTEGGVVSTGTYVFSAGIDLGSVQRVRLRSHIRAATINIRDLFDSRTGNVDDWENFDGEVAPGAADAWVEVRATNDNPAGSPTWSEWQRLDVAEFNARAFQFRAQLRSYDPAYRPEVSELRAFAEDPSI